MSKERNSRLAKKLFKIIDDPDDPTFVKAVAVVSGLMLTGGVVANSVMHRNDSANSEINARSSITTSNSKNLSQKISPEISAVTRLNRLKP